MYLAFKLLHVVAVVVFLGNIITGVFWKLHGDRTRDPVSWPRWWMESPSF